MSRLRALAAIALALLAGCNPARPGLQPRNLVLVTCDGLRADHLSCYAHSRPSSALPSDPHQRLEGRALALDDLAASGVVFAQAFAPSPLRLPSLAALLTGRPPVETGVLDDRSRLPRDLPTLAELAHAAGFASAAFVTQPRVDILSALGRGFDEAHACASDADTLALARSWLERDFGDHARVFLWIHLSGLEPPWEEIPTSQLEEPEMWPRRFLDPRYHGPADGSPAFFERVQRGDPPLDPADRVALSELYDGRIAAVLGRLTSFLRDAFDYHRRGAEVTEFWSRSLLIFAGTHGFDLGERGNALAAELQDDQLLVPLILRHPDSLTGERVMLSTVELTDVLPTVVELLDLPRPRVVVGRSLLALTDAHPSQRFAAHSAITQTGQRIFSVRDARWRMIWNPYRSKFPAGDPHRDLPVVALYDHASGRAGTEDVSALYPDVVSRLQQEVKNWITHQVFRASLPIEGRRALEAPKH